MGSNRTDFQGRRSLGSRLCMLLVFLCGMAVSNAFAQQEATNVVFIMTDDQGIWSLGCYGNPEIRTPNLDRLATAALREAARRKKKLVELDVVARVIDRDSRED